MKIPIFSYYCFSNLLKQLVIAFLVMLPFFAKTQNAKVDSLLRLIKVTAVDSVRVDGYLKMTAYHKRRDLDSALFYARKAHQYFYADLNSSLKIRIYNTLGLIHKMDGDLDSALYYYLLNESQVKSYNQPEELGRFHNNLGNLYQTREEKLVAYEHYLKALEFFKQDKNPKEIANVQNNIAINFLLDREYQKGLKYLFLAYHLRDSVGSENGVIASLSNIGITYKDLKMYDSATIYLEESLHRSRQIDNTKGIATALNNLSLVSKRMGDFDKSKEYLKEAIKLNYRVGADLSLASCYINLAGILQKQKQYSQAIIYADSGALIADHLGALGYKKSAVQLLGQINQELGNYQIAIEFFNEHDQLKDSIYDIVKTKQIQELEGKYESSRKDSQIANLELERKNTALKLANSNNQRNIFIFGFVIILVVAAFIYYRYASNKKTAGILAGKNAEITAALEERELLLKEIHHRVKNNLQVIWSMLRMQARSLKNEEALEAVKQGQNRVKSMALIHQKLYSTDGLSGVMVQDYFENLAGELLSAFGASDIETHIQAEGMSLDIDTIIPLGLIINELLTNSIKYAFKDLEAGEIELSVHESSEKLLVQFKDNGKGVEESMLNQNQSFGWKMIRSLARQLKADVEILNNNGTVINLSLSRYTLVA